MRTIFKSLVGTAATAGVAMSGQLVVALVVVAVLVLVLVGSVLWRDGPAARLTGLIEAWRSGEAGGRHPPER